MIDKVSKMIEKLELLKKAKKRYVVESRKYYWHQIDSQNSLWSKNVQPIINEIEIDLVELWSCISENGSGKWTSTGIENAINSRKPDLMDALIQEFKIVRQGLEIKSQQHPKPAEKSIPEGSAFVFLTGELPEGYPEEIYGETPCELVEILLKSINGYRRYFYCRPKNKLVNERLQPNLEHDKAIVWRNGLYTTASKIKAKCPELPNIPQPTGEPDLDVTPLHQWAINVKKILVPSEQPAETGQKTISATLRKIWTCVKRIPRWIYVLVIFFAALLTIFHYLGWLEPIRTFIHSILWPK